MLLYFWHFYYLYHYQLLLWQLTNLIIALFH